MNPLPKHCRALQFPLRTPFLLRVDLNSTAGQTSLSRPRPLAVCVFAKGLWMAFLHDRHSGTSWTYHCRLSSESPDCEQFNSYSPCSFAIDIYQPRVLLPTQVLSRLWYKQISSLHILISAEGLFLLKPYLSLNFSTHVGTHVQSLNCIYGW